MYLRRFVVTCSFGAWSPGDRDSAEGRISISPGMRDLFTDDDARQGVFVKFLKNGNWYESDRSEFRRCTLATEREPAAVR